MPEGCSSSGKKQPRRLRSTGRWFPKLRVKIVEIQVFYQFVIAEGALGGKRNQGDGCRAISVTDGARATHACKMPALRAASPANP